MKLRFLTSVLLASSLAACASSQIPPVTTYVAVTIPDILLLPCTVTPPMAPSVYMSASEFGKKALLAKYSQSLLTDLSLCNKNLDLIKEYQTEQRHVIEGVKP